jgi:excisionase family DNA binding protein
MDTTAVRIKTARNEARMPLLLRGVEVAEVLGISRALAYRWMAGGVLPTVRIRGSRAVRVPREALLDWVERNTQQPAGGAAA